MEAPIRILYMCETFQKGGVEQYILNVLDYIGSDQFEIEIALPGEYIHPNEHALIERHVKVHHYAIDSTKKQIESIHDILYANHYDIVHVIQANLFLNESTLFALVVLHMRRKLKYKVILHSHNSAHMSTQTSFILRKLARSALHGILRRFFGRADACAACSREAGLFLFGKHRKFTILNNGILLSKFQRNDTTDEMKALREKYCIPTGTPVISTVARLSSEKNLLSAVDIICELRKFYPQVIGCMVGDGPMREEIRAYIHKRGMDESIHMLGIQDKVEEILSFSDCLLLPSIFEGSPLILLEAQASNVYVFCSDRVPRGGDCGGCTFIPLEQSADEWALRIYKTMQAERSPKINAEKMSCFDIRRTVFELENYYRSVICSEI